jgi:hypothetical protein
MSIHFWKSWRTLPATARPSKQSARRPSKRRPQLERLEDRIVPSAPESTAHVDYIVYRPPGGQPYASPGPVGYTPQQIQKAYGVDQLYGIVGNGAGQTIAIVDAYDEPAFVDSTSPNFLTSDLHLFDVQFGLPDPPSFIKLNQTGGTTLPGTDPAGAGTSNWEGEEALDVEWAHAIAPGANIILFEANSASGSDLDQAVQTAAGYPGVSVISMSWGGPEDNTATTTDSIFTTPAGHQGVTFLAASGDTGSYVPNTSTVAVNYPAVSPNVLSVGGTNLVLNSDNSYKSETAWGSGTSSGTNGGSGGGISQYEPEPAYQDSVQSTGFRTVPDVAFDADPASGVAVYDSYNNGTSTPWTQVGGTSLASPSWAGLIAIADEGAVASGGTTLNGATQTIPTLYKLYQIDPGYFHDITSGSNGAYTAGPGYDEVTGMGTPVANKLIPALIGLEVTNTLNAATEGQLLNNVAVATFHDPTGPQPLSDYTATITWGDGGSSNGTVVSDGGDLYTVLGSYTYVNAGTYPLTVSVQNTAFDLAGTSTSNVNVVAAPLTGSPQLINGQAGAFVSNALVAIFTDTDPTPRPAGEFSATIQWSEGNGLVSTSVGTIQALGGNSFSVNGSTPFTYPIGGLLPVNVMIKSTEGASVTVGSTANVANNLGTSSQLAQYQSDTNPLNAPFVSMEDALTNLLTAERLFFFSLAYGTQQEQMGSFGNLVNAFYAYEGAIYQYDLQLPGS